MANEPWIDLGQRAFQRPKFESLALTWAREPQKDKNKLAQVKIWDSRFSHSGVFRGAVCRHRFFWSLVEDVVELLREKHRHRKRVCQNPENGKGALGKKIALIIITFVINWRNIAILATI